MAKSQPDDAEDGCFCCSLCFGVFFSSAELFFCNHQSRFPVPFKPEQLLLSSLADKAMV